GVRGTEKVGAPRNPPDAPRPASLGRPLPQLQRDVRRPIQVALGPGSPSPEPRCPRAVGTKRPDACIPALRRRRLRNRVIGHNYLVTPIISLQPGEFGVASWLVMPVTSMERAR